MSRNGRELASSTLLARPCETRVATSIEVKPCSVVTRRDYLPYLVEQGHVVAQNNAVDYGSMTERPAERPSVSGEKRNTHG